MARRENIQDDAGGRDVAQRRVSIRDERRRGRYVIALRQRAAFDSLGDRVQQPIVIRR
jgi:hypothetical protein